MTSKNGPRSGREAKTAPVPLVEACPSCGSPLQGQRCKVYCGNENCPLYRRIIENCAGD